MFKKLSKIVLFWILINVVFANELIISDKGLFDKNGKLITETITSDIGFRESYSINLPLNNINKDSIGTLKYEIIGSNEPLTCVVPIFKNNDLYEFKNFFCFSLRINSIKMKRELVFYTDKIIGTLNYLSSENTIANLVGRNENTKYIYPKYNENTNNFIIKINSTIQCFINAKNDDLAYDNFDFSKCK